MRSILKTSFFIFLLLLVSASSYGKEQKVTKSKIAEKAIKKGQEVKVEIETSYGKIKLKLYNGTPGHRDNFIKLVEEGFYEGVLFHRVIPNFMIQGGDPQSKNATSGQRLGAGNPGYTIPAEFVPAYYHKRGALAAARTGNHTNPQKASSGSQFYIVTGKTVTDKELDDIENKLLSNIERPIYQRLANERMEEIKKYQKERNNEKVAEIHDAITAEVKKESGKLTPFKYTPEQRETYKTEGGTPFLDTEYTVFGEVIEGMDVVDKISATETSSGDRPKEDIRILKVRIVKK